MRTLALSIPLVPLAAALFAASCTTTDPPQSSTGTSGSAGGGASASSSADATTSTGTGGSPEATSGSSSAGSSAGSTGGGGGGGCNGGVACDDGNPCTADTCTPGGCVATPAPPGASCGAMSTCSLQGTCVAGTALWSRVFPSTSIQALAPVSDGVIFGGALSTSADLGGGLLTPAPGIFIGKLDAFGTHLFSKAFAPSTQPLYVQLNAVAPDGAGGVYFGGDYWGTFALGATPLSCAGGPGNPRAFLAHFDASGQHVSSRCFSDANQQQLFALAADGKGGVIAGGYIGGAVDFGGGPIGSDSATTLFVASFDATGKHVYSRAFFAQSQSVNALAVDGAGGVTLAGSFQGTTDFGTGPLTSGAAPDAFLVKLDAAGKTIWSRKFGDATQMTHWQIAATTAGATVAFGSFSGSVDLGGGALASQGGLDLFLARYDVAGNHVSSKSFGGPADAWGAALALDAAGDALLAGYFSGTLDLAGKTLTSQGVNDDVFVARLDATGALLSASRFGDGGAQRARRVGAASASDVYLAGDFDGGLDFLGSPALTAVGTSAFLARITP
jgi:hypothetical protein